MSNFSNLIAPQMAQSNKLVYMRTSLKVSKSQDKKVLKTQMVGFNFIWAEGPHAKIEFVYSKLETAGHNIAKSAIHT